MAYYAFTKEQFDSLVNDFLTRLRAKFDKSGGEVTGDVKIDGNLTLDIPDEDYDSGITFTKVLDDNLGEPTDSVTENYNFDFYIRIFLRLLFAFERPVFAIISINCFFAVSFKTVSPEMFKISIFKTRHKGC